VTAESTKKRVYLAGAIEATEDSGRGWRERVASELAELGYEAVWPPGLKEPERLGLSLNSFNDLKVSDLNRYQEVMRTSVIAQDVQALLSSDFLWVRWEKEFSAGTVSEAFLAYLAGIPVLLVSEVPLPSVPGWLLALTSKRFVTAEEALTWLSDASLEAASLEHACAREAYSQSLLEEACLSLLKRVCELESRSLLTY